MKRFVLPLIAIALSAGPGLASEMRSARMTKQATFRPTQSEFSGNIVGLQIANLPDPPLPMPAHRPLHVRIVEFVGCPIRPIVEYLKSPNSELRRLLNESEDLRKVREQFQRFAISNTVRPF